MKFSLTFALILLAALVSVSCYSDAPTTTTANANATNAKTPVAAASPAASVASNSAVAIPSPTVQVSENSAAPCAVYRAHYDALVKRDENAFRKTLTAETIRKLEADAKAEGDKTIVGHLTAYESPSTKPPICGGSVQGDQAALQVQDGETGTVYKRKAVKENGEWKLDLRTVEF